MKRNRLSLILDYLGTNTAEKKRKIEERFLESGMSVDEIQELSQLYNNLEKITPPEPDSGLTEKFYTMLEEEKAKYQFKIKHADRYIWIGQLFEKKKLAVAAVAIGIFFVGWVVGYQFSSNKEYKTQVSNLLNEVHSTQKMLMLTLLEQPSATDRLKAINLGSKLPATDNKVTDALLNVLNNDPDVNVRLVALDALSQFSRNPKVRIGLIQSIANQDSPIVQIALANTMVQLQEKRSVKELKKLLEKNNVDETVKKEVKNSINKLI
ncbi:MAG TPA: HEAT repeat domain-containing protein [Bacteroidales bacterium]